MVNKRIYVDMDGVICDYYTAYQIVKKERPEIQHPQSLYGFFIGLKSIPYSIDMVQYLSKKYDLWFLSKPSVYNINSYSEKALWIYNNFGFELQKRLILSSDKSLLKGDYLIDDQTNANQDKFEGEHILFGSPKFPNWIEVVKYLDNINKI
jgi:5'-nucleotidase